MRLSEVNNTLMLEGKSWAAIKAFVTGKATIDKDSEIGKLMKNIDNEVRKKIPGSDKTYLEAMEDEMKKQGINVKPW